jgi:hypothetical protein
MTPQRNVKETSKVPQDLLFLSALGFSHTAANRAREQSEKPERREDVSQAVIHGPGTTASIKFRKEQERTKQAIELHHVYTRRYSP